MYDLDFTEVAEEAGFLSRIPDNFTIDPRIEQTRFVAYNILAPIIVTVGIIGNLLTIVILRLPQFKGVTYTLFFVLAISDLLSLFLCISMLVHLLQGGTRLYSTAVWFSYYETIFTNAPMSTSTLIIVCITIDRYFSVCRPAHFKTIHTNRYARRGIIMAVVLAIITWLPTAALKVPKYYKECHTTSFKAPDDGTWWVSCMKDDTRKNPWYITYSWIRQAITMFIPLVILIILNCLIVKDFVRLRRKKKEMMGRVQPKDSPTTEHRKKENQHLIHLLTAVMISFCITIVPSGIFGALYDESLSTRFTFELLRALANDLEILNHALNFYLYILYSKPIRDAIANIYRNQQKLGSLAASNIMVVIQRTSNLSAQGDNSQPQAVARVDGDVVMQVRKGKSNKKALRETQYSDLASDDESSFNKIVSVDEVKKDKVKSPKPKEASNPTDDRAFLEYHQQNNTAYENVYLRAVVNHQNKPPHGFQTVVLTAEIHNSQAEEEPDPPLTTEETKEAQEKTIVKENGHIPNEQGHLVRDSESVVPTQRHEDVLSETQVIIIDEESANKSLCVTKDSGGLVNPAFELDEISVTHKHKVDRPNGNIITSSFLMEKL